MEIVSIPAIATLCVIAAQIYKTATPDSWSRYIPALCALAGGIFGLVCYYFVPGIMPADNAVFAAILGVVSGWGATGAHQTVKQAQKAGEAEDEQ